MDFGALPIMFLYDVHCILKLKEVLKMSLISETSRLIFKDPWFWKHRFKKRMPWVRLVKGCNYYQEYKRILQESKALEKKKVPKNMHMSEAEIASEVRGCIQRGLHPCSILYGETLFFHLILKADNETLIDLLERGFPIHQRSAKNKSVLEYWIESTPKGERGVECLSILIRFGARATRMDALFKTMWHDSIISRYKECYPNEEQKLLDLGFPIGDTAFIEHVKRIRECEESRAFIKECLSRIDLEECKRNQISFYDSEDGRLLIGLIELVQTDQRSDQRSLNIDWSLFICLYGWKLSQSIELPQIKCCKPSRSEISKMVEYTQCCIDKHLRESEQSLDS